MEALTAARLCWDLLPEDSLVPAVVATWAPYLESHMVYNWTFCFRCCILRISSIMQDFRSLGTVVTQRDATGGRSDLRLHCSRRPWNSSK